jgi:hypothetical protein
LAGIDLSAHRRLGYALAALVAAWFVSIGFTGTQYVNCRLTTCSWFDVGKIVLSLVALGLAWNDFKDARQRGGPPLLLMPVYAALAMAALFSAVNGAGLVGPAPCPVVKPGC